MTLARFLVASATVLGSAHVAWSDIVYTDIPDVHLSAGASGSLDINQDGAPDIHFTAGSPGSWAVCEPGVEMLTVEEWYAGSVPPGELIGVPGQTWESWVGIMWDCEFNPYCSSLPFGTYGFLGARLALEEGSFNHAWIRASSSWDSGGATLTIYDFAYETTPEAPIPAGGIDCPVDCNQNGQCDLMDIIIGGSVDANGNHVSDECEPVVTVRVPDDYPTINDAVAALPANASTILVAPGVHNIGDLSLGVRPLTIRGDGPRGGIVIEGSYLIANGAARLENLSFGDCNVDGAHASGGMLLLGCDAFNSTVIVGDGGRMDRCRLIALASDTQTVLHVASAAVSNSEIVRLGSFPYAAVFANGTRFVNCTIAQAASAASAIDSPWVPIVVENSIVRSDGLPAFTGVLPLVRYSDVSGGWPGDGNIDADPLFVRNPSAGPDGVWGTSDDDFGDLRLRAGSPCIDAGDNAALPPDHLDLDGDGDTTEPVPFDLAGLARVVRGLPGPGTAVVDMGAYERQMRWRRVWPLTAVEYP
jgi:hypothetical protein